MPYIPLLGTSWVASSLLFLNILRATGYISGGNTRKGDYYTNEDDPVKYIAKINYTKNKLIEPEYKPGRRRFGKDLEQANKCESITPPNFVENEYKNTSEERSFLASKL